MSAALDPQSATRARMADAAEGLFGTLGCQKAAVADRDAALDLLMAGLRPVK